SGDPKPTARERVPMATHQTGAPTPTIPMTLPSPGPAETDRPPNHSLTRGHIARYLRRKHGRRVRRLQSPSASSPADIDDHPQEVTAPIHPSDLDGASHTTYRRIAIMATLRPSVRLAAGACLLLATAYGDEPVAPRGVEREMEVHAASTISALFTCAVDLAAETMSCDPAEGPSGPAGGPQMNLIVGSQHHFVRMANDAPVVSEDVWSANVTVQNLTLQPFNTLNGEDAHPAGVRVFFVDEPTNGVVVSNHDGTAPFIDSDPAKYYAYTGADLGGDEILAPGEESEPKGWVFELNGATEFVFSVLISTTVPDPTNVTAGLVRVVTGGFHSCGEDPYGRGYGWGDNGFGQVGDSTAVSQRYVPTRVAAPKGVTLSGVVAGHFRTCAEGSDGKVYCWGQNMVGQLGDGSTTNRLAPVAVSAPANVALSRLSAGDYHTCANGSDDEIYCWGSNFYGALGDGTKIDSWTPVTVSSPDSVQLVGPEAGGFHTCAR